MTEMFWWWIETHTGIVHLGSPYYGFFSGIGSIILPPVLTLIGVWLLLLWHRTCYKPWCPRPGRVPMAGGHYKACHRHHPDVPKRKHRWQAALEHHEEWKRATPGYPL